MQPQLTWDCLDRPSTPKLAGTVTSDAARVCRHVVVTVPLGVLKKGSVAFVPPLPACKRASIARLGVGLLDKVALVFKPDQVFWDKNVPVSEVLLANRSSSGSSFIVHCLCDVFFASFHLAPSEIFA